MQSKRPDGPAATFETHLQVRSADGGPRTFHSRLQVYRLHPLETPWGSARRRGRPGSGGPAAAARPRRLRTRSRARRAAARGSRQKASGPRRAQRPRGRSPAARTACRPARASTRRRVATPRARARPGPAGVPRRLTQKQTYNRPEASRCQHWHMPTACQQRDCALVSRRCHRADPVSRAQEGSAGARTGTCASASSGSMTRRVSTAQRLRPLPCSRKTSKLSACGPTVPPGAAKLTMTCTLRRCGVRWHNAH
jgi:hypothetical protein